ncbi:MAG TPA: hypothetical protein VD884_11425 [Ohtaekwangia sp.]|nr:hypothetical protein [Ohtaekwangia sp.]
MRFALITVITILSSTSCFSQSNPNNFIYGTLYGTTSYTGYFWFDPVLTQMGQRITYKETLETKKKKKLWAMNFDTFQSDSLFLRRFKTMPFGTGHVESMVPRIVMGKLQLYSASWRGFYSLRKSDHFFIYDGIRKIRLIRKKFEEQMTELLAGDVDLVERIEREELNYDDMPSIILNYNLRQAKSKF